MESESFDLILLDSWMPQMNGFEAARRIRELPDPQIATVPIVASTADVTDEPTAESRRSGIPEVVAKPTSADKLVGLLHT